MSVCPRTIAVAVGGPSRIPSVGVLISGVAAREHDALEILRAFGRTIGRRRVGPFIILVIRDDRRIEVFLAG